MLPKRFLAGQILTHKLLIDDDEFVVFQPLIVGEEPSADQRDFHSSKIAGIGRAIRSKMMHFRCLSRLLRTAKRSRAPCLLRSRASLPEGPPGWLRPSTKSLAAVLPEPRPAE